MNSESRKGGCPVGENQHFCIQARAEGIELGSKQIAQERLLKHELQKALDRRKLMQQVAQDQQAAAAVEAAAHVASLQQHIQDLKVAESTLITVHCALPFVHVTQNEGQESCIWTRRLQQA